MLHIRQNRTSGISSGCDEHKNVRSVVAPSEIYCNFLYLPSQDTDRGDAVEDWERQDVVTKFTLWEKIRVVGGLFNVFNEVS